MLNVLLFFEINVNMYFKCLLLVPLHINHTSHTFININCLLEIDIFFQSIFKVPFRNCLSKGLSLRSEFKQLLAY